MLNADSGMNADVSFHADAGLNPGGGLDRESSRRYTKGRPLG
jgi:hypothetical protein